MRRMRNNNLKIRTAGSSCRRKKQQTDRTAMNK